MLGRTDLSVSKVGLGMGGISRSGLRAGASHDQAERLVMEAYERGINLFDTAPNYGTESILRRATQAVDRSDIVVSTKAKIRRGGERINGSALDRSISKSLATLGSDYIDIFMLHGVEPDDYTYGRDELLSVLERNRTAGRLRSIGITESFRLDPSHNVARRAIIDDCWDAIMVGLNLANFSARDVVLPLAARTNVGLILMHVVREALVESSRFSGYLAQFRSLGVVDMTDPEIEDLVGTLSKADANGLPGASYRFAAATAPDAVVLTGTGNVRHLDENLASLERGRLPDQVLALVQRQLGHVSVGAGNMGSADRLVGELRAAQEPVAG